MLNHLQILNHDVHEKVLPDNQDSYVNPEEQTKEQDSEEVWGEGKVCDYTW